MSRKKFFIFIYRKIADNVATKTRMIAINTAVEHISFVAFAKILYSGDIISTTHSIAVFNNSTIKSKRNADRTIAHLIKLKSVVIATIVRTTIAKRISCLKATSFLNAHLNPSIEYLNAFNRCAIPFD